ncbi:hypothetical protein N483_00485 [Pseudoalteromonas luteoviolacea NCIMB 1944]|nr:hypothetical protein N483_00485 [Pseudoalteromonas luteoviolacea NCIMB 1944]
MSTYYSLSYSPLQVKTQTKKYRSAIIEPVTIKYSISYAFIIFMPKLHKEQTRRKFV